MQTQQTQQIGFQLPTRRLLIVALPAFSAVLRPRAAAYAVQHAIDVS